MSIWRHKNINRYTKTYLSLEEGETEIRKIKINNKEIFLKLETQNPTGSWKDRGTSFKISELKEQNVKKALLFSSGNAAISFLRYGKLYPELKLTIILSKKISQEKLEIIQKNKENHRIIVTHSPREKRAELLKTGQYYDLRASKDNFAFIGYKSIGYELIEYFGDSIFNENTGIFIPVSSGTAFIGIWEALKENLKEKIDYPKLIACQTTEIHPLYDRFYNQNIKVDNEKSLADSIVDNINLNSPKLMNILKKTKGGVLKINNQSLSESNKIVSNQIKLSFTSLLGLSGARNFEDLKTIICIASGK